VQSQEVQRAQAFDALELRAAYGCFPSGVTAICALIDGEPLGLVASSFTTVSLDPPLVSFAVRKESTTWPVLRGVPMVGVCVLADAHRTSCRAIAGQDRGERFSGVAWKSDPNSGSVLIDDAAIEMKCKVVDEIEAGDHHLVVLEVLHLVARPSVTPLVFHNSQFGTLTGTTPSL